MTMRKLGRRMRPCGILLAVIIAGCGKAPDPGKSEGAASKHEHKPPHGGTLVEFGEEFAHLEFVLDPDLARLTAYALDGEAEAAVRMDAPEIVLTIDAASDPIRLGAVPSPLTGEKVGDASEFTAIVTSLKGAKRFAGVIPRIKLRGREFLNVSFAFPEGNEGK